MNAESAIAQQHKARSPVDRVSRLDCRASPTLALQARCELSLRDDKRASASDERTRDSRKRSQNQKKKKKRKKKRNSQSDSERVCANSRLPKPSKALAYDNLRAAPVRTRCNFQVIDAFVDLFQQRLTHNGACWKRHFDRRRRRCSSGCGVSHRWCSGVGRRDGWRR